jgi:hypothetical protein
MADVNIDTARIRALRDQAAKEALWAQGQAVIAEAQKARLVPIETGTLRRSAFVSVNNLPDPDAIYQGAKSRRQAQAQGNPPAGGGPAVRVFVSYNTPYAARLHENLDWRPRAWKRTAMGTVVAKPAEGGPKWVEKALALAKPKFEAIAARVFRRFF